MPIRQTAVIWEGYTNNGNVPIAGNAVWRVVKKSDPLAVDMANRHYSRIAFGSQGVMLGPPGRLLCFRAWDDSAIWVSHWPYQHLALDKLDAWRCTMFRNEGQQLSSDMIVSAMELSQRIWAKNPPAKDEWITWVAPDLVESSNPGYCFRKAGWWRDKAWRSSRTDVRLWRFRAHAAGGCCI